MYHWRHVPLAALVQHISYALAAQAVRQKQVRMSAQPRPPRAPFRSYLNAKTAGRKQDAGGQDAGGLALADLPFAVPDVEHPRRVVAALPATNVNAKAALLAEHVENFWKWRFQLRHENHAGGGLCLLGPITNIQHLDAKLESASQLTGFVTDIVFALLLPQGHCCVHAVYILADLAEVDCRAWLSLHGVLLLQITGRCSR